MSDEADGFKLDDEALQKIGQGLDLVLNGPVMSEDRTTGWVLLIWPFHSPAIANYLSNGDRETMIKALEETVARLKSREDNPRGNQDG